MDSARHIMISIVNPRFLGQMPSYDVASSIQILFATTLATPSTQITKRDKQVDVWAQAEQTRVSPYEVESTIRQSL